MAIFDAGIFLILSVLAFLTLLISQKQLFSFKIISGIIFFSLAIVLMANYDVAFKTTTLDGATTINQTKYLIGDGVSTTDDNTSWLAWIYMMFGFYAALGFFFDLFNINTKNFL